MRLARLAVLLAALVLAPLASRAADDPPFRWDGVWAGLGASSLSTEFGLPGPQPFFTGAGLTGPTGTSVRSSGLDLSLARLWQRRQFVFGLEASRSGASVDFTDPWPARILADVTQFQNVCADCTHLMVNGTVTTGTRLRALAGIARPDGTLWFASFGRLRGHAALTALGAFEDRGASMAGIVTFGQMDVPLRGVTIGFGHARPFGQRSALRMEVSQDRLTGATPDGVSNALGPRFRIRSTRFTLSYQLRF